MNFKATALTLSPSDRFRDCEKLKWKYYNPLLGQIKRSKFYNVAEILKGLWKEILS